MLAPDAEPCADTLAEAEPAADADEAGVLLGESVPETEAIGERDGTAETVATDGVAEREASGLGELERDEETLAAGLLEPFGVTVEEGEALVAAVGLADGLAFAESELIAEELGEAELARELEASGEAETEALAASEALGVVELEPLADGEGEFVSLCESVAEMLGEPVADGLVDGDCESVGEGDSVAEPDVLPLTEPLGVSVGAPLSVAVIVIDAEIEPLADGDGEVEAL